MVLHTTMVQAVQIVPRWCTGGTTPPPYYDFRQIIIDRLHVPYHKKITPPLIFTWASYFSPSYFYPQNFTLSCCSALFKIGSDF